MLNSISSTITQISSFLKKLQVKNLFAVVLVGFLVLTTSVDARQNNQALRENVREQIQQNDAQRPKTLGQWEKEARQTEDAPIERLQKIGQESGEALKEFGSGYVEGAKETVRDIKNSAS
ncbi:MULTISPECIES: hypothetical protein [unclassified Anabaena]|uniref:hypothetical protein n=1 Tax=unclassified Anabaena TaxID=2619674 RepID=UPI0039C62BA3